MRLPFANALELPRHGPESTTTLESKDSTSLIGIGTRYFVIHYAGSTIHRYACRNREQLVRGCDLKNGDSENPQELNFQFVGSVAAAKITETSKIFHFVDRIFDLIALKSRTYCSDDAKLSIP